MNEHSNYSIILCGEQPKGSLSPFEFYRNYHHLQDNHRERNGFVYLTSLTYACMIWIELTDEYLDSDVIVMGKYVFNIIILPRLSIME